jgi:hypothetical protein
VWLGLHFDDFMATDDQRHKAFLQLIAGTGRRISTFGGQVPLEYCNNEFDSPRCKYRTPQYTAPWIESLETLRRFLLGDSQ